MEILEECADGLNRLLNFYERVSLSAEEEELAGLIKEEIDYEHALEDLRSIIMDCREGAERIRDVVQNLRTFSRLDEAEFKKVDIHEGLDSTIRLLSRYYTAGHIKLNREYTKLPPVDCYAGQLNQVWMNLLANAAQAVKDGGEVTIRTKHEGREVVVLINASLHRPFHILRRFRRAARHAFQRSVGAHDRQWEGLDVQDAARVAVRDESSHRAPRPIGGAIAVHQLMRDPHPRIVAALTTSFDKRDW